MVIVTDDCLSDTLSSLFEAYLPPVVILPLRRVANQNLLVIVFSTTRFLDLRWLDSVFKVLQFTITVNTGKLPSEIPWSRFPSVSYPLGLIISSGHGKTKRKRHVSISFLVNPVKSSVDPQLRIAFTVSLGQISTYILNAITVVLGQCANIVIETTPLMYLHI
jgi:hypothetical protein